MGLNRKLGRSQVLLHCFGSQQKCPSGGSVSRLRELSSGFGHTPPSSYCLFQQIAHPHQIVGRQRPSEHPTHPSGSPEARFAHPPHGLQPTKDFFHPFAQALASPVTGTTGCPAIQSRNFLSCFARRARRDCRLCARHRPVAVGAAPRRRGVPHRGHRRRHNPDCRGMYCRRHPPRPRR